MPDSELYKANGESFIWTHWEDSSALFNRATGETHILDALPTEILLLLSDGPADTGTLAQQLSKLCDMPCSSDWVRRTTDSLDELHALDLVEKFSASAC